MFYESEITLLPNGRVTMVTTGRDWGNGENYSLALNEETTYQYPSVEKLRKFLTREKFDIEALKIIGVSMLCAGTWLTTPSIFNPAGPDYKQIISGSVAFIIGYGALKMGITNEPKVNSMIHAFNDKLPDLRPIPLNIRDFLTRRIPFLHR